MKPEKDSTEVMTKEWQVVRTETGRKYVVHTPHALPKNASIVCDFPHEGGDYSYLCGRDWCQCMD